MNDSSRPNAVSSEEASSPAAHRATERVLDILELVVASREGLALRDLSEALDAPKTSLLPLLRTLTARGYLEQGRAGEYLLGEKALEMGTSSLSSRELPDVARSAMTELMKQTGETVMLAILIADGNNMIYIDQVESEHVIRYSARLGEPRPLHATAGGKAILAFLPQDRRTAMIQSMTLNRFTETTITSKSALRNAIEEIQQTGVCINVDQKVKGATAIAAPIFDRDGAVIGACVVGVPSSRAHPLLKQLASQVKRAAEKISARLGYRVDDSDDASPATGRRLAAARSSATISRVKRRDYPNE